MMRLFSRQAGDRERRDELLSAYLDGELSAGEQTRLETQLTTDPALLAELETLRHTVALVHDLPQVPIPHNFILPQTVAARPAPAERPRRTWPASLLTAATAVASLLFVAVLSLDLFLPRMGGNLAFAPAPEPQMAAEAPREVEVTQQVEQEVDEAIEAPPPAAEVPVEALPEATAEAEEMERGEVLAPGEEKATSPPAGGGLTDEAATPTPIGVSPTAPPTALGAGAEEEEGYQWDSAPGEDAEALPLPAEAEAVGASEGEEATIALPTSWRALEVALGLTALGLALVTIRAWRARRR